MILCSLKSIFQGEYGFTGIIKIGSISEKIWLKQVAINNIIALLLLCLGIWAQANWYISDNYKGNTMSSNQFRSPDLTYIWWRYALNTEFSGTAYARVLRPGTILTIVFLRYKNRYQKRSNKKMHLLMSYEYFTWLKHDFFALCWKKTL